MEQSGSSWKIDSSPYFHWPQSLRSLTNSSFLVKPTTPNLKGPRSKIQQQLLARRKVTFHWREHRLRGLLFQSARRPASCQCPGRNRQRLPGLLQLALEIDDLIRLLAFGISRGRKLRITAISHLQASRRVGICFCLSLLNAKFIAATNTRIFHRGTAGHV